MTAESAAAGLRHLARSLHDTTTAEQAARVGFIARALFYATLAVLTLRVATLGGSGRQDNANGALSTVCSSVVGMVIVAIAAAGFVALGLVRVLTAWRDRDGSRSDRALTALQGIGCWAVAAVPLSFLVGNRQAGSEQQQHKTAAGLLGLPAGRALVGVIGLAVLAVCAYQIRTALAQDFEDGLRLRGAPRWVKELVRLSGTVGIASRAVVLGPVGVFLIVTAIRVNPDDAKGLDAEVLALARHGWGVAVLVLCALGLLAFSLYSALEARYRDVRSV